MRTNRTMHDITHKAVTTALMLGIFATTPLVAGLSAHAEESGPIGGVLQGSVIKTKQTPDLPTVNANDIKEIAPGTTLDMVISTAVTTGVNVSGDEFFGKVSKDYTVDGKVVIPKGTIVHGLVQAMEDPKRAGRNGYISTKFDYMITPDGREIAIEGNSTTRDSAGKAALKVAGRTAGFTLGGGVVGAIMVMRYGGMAAVAATNGYALAGGAALGGALGLTSALVTKGHNAMIQPGAEIRVKLVEDLKLPTVNMPDAGADNYALNGLKVKVLGMRYDKDPFGEPNEITVTLDVDNKTENTFSTFEIGLEDEYGNIFYPSPFGDTGMWFSKIEPNTHASNNLTFNVDNIKYQHKLVFFKQYSREPLAKIALTDAMVKDKKNAKLSKKADKVSAATPDF
jgi:hypothetical protein